MTPEEAERALDEASRAQSAALRNAPPLFPAWYLGAVWGGVAALQLVTEVLSGAAVWIGLAVVVLGLVALAVKLVRDMSRLAMRPHISAIDPWGWLGFLAWLFGTQIFCFVLLAAFSAADFTYPRTASCLVTLVLALLTAPAVPRWMAARGVRRMEAERPES